MKVSIVIPAHDESDGLSRFIEEVIPALERHDSTKDFEVLTVGMTDDPASYGDAIKAGLKKASGEVVVLVSPWLAEDPDDIHLLVEKIEEGYDVAYGSRFCKGGSVRGYPRKRMLAGRSFNRSVRLLFGTEHRDTTNAFKAYRREVIDRICVDGLEADGFDLNVEMPLKAHIHGFTSVEVPVRWDGKGHAGDIRLYREGSRYGRKLVRLFVYGNVVSLKDILFAVLKGSPIFMIIATLVGLLLLAGIFSIAGFAQILTILSRLSPIYLFIACVAFLAASVIRTVRWNVLIKAAGYRVSLEDLLRVNFFGWLINYLLPAGLGDFMRPFALKMTKDMPLSVGLTTIVVEGSIDMICLATLMIVSLMMISGNGQLIEFAGLSILLAFGMIISLVLIYKYDHVIYRISDRFKPLQKSVDSFKKGLLLMAKNPVAIAWCLALTFVVWLVDISTIYFASRAIGLDLSVSLTLVTGVTAFIGQAIPITPAGIGIYEGTIAGILYLFGMDVSAGTSIALVDHFARGIVTYTLGFIATIHIGFMSRRYFIRVGKSRKAEEVEA